MTADVVPIRPSRAIEGLGELLRAHRMYLGISQRTMAERLNMARRSYQRLENDVDRCPPNLMADVEALIDKFDDDVDTVIEHACLNNGAELLYTESQDWERSVAGRAAVLGDDKGIKLTMTIERTR